jgi:hypothetical protein
LRRRDPGRINSIIIGQENKHQAALAEPFLKSNTRGYCRLIMLLRKYTQIILHHVRQYRDFHGSIDDS